MKMGKAMWVKICGIASQAAAERVIAHAPDAVGLNFYSGSKRCLSADVAREIVRRLPTEVRPVGLFVNHSQREIEEICDHCSIQTIQLHGDESPEFAATLRRFQIIRAFRVGPEGLAVVAQELQRYADLDVPLLAALIDARTEGTYGGSGHVAPWHLLREWKSHWPHMVLAGGLSPDNVRMAIDAVGPWGVDVASGVEAAPGLQDSEKVRLFVEQARISSL